MSGQQTGYSKLTDGSLCPSGQEIASEADCKAAAGDLQLSWAHSWEGPGNFPACLFSQDRNQVFFNLSPKPSKTHNNPRYEAICRMASETTVAPQISQGFVDPLGLALG